MRQPFEIALLLAIIALAVALIAYLLRPHLGSKRTERPDSSPGPQDRRERPGGQERGGASPSSAALIGADPSRRRSPTQSRRGRGGDDVVTAPRSCPACHQTYEPGFRFCPKDGRELQPALALSSLPAKPDEDGKICPHCGRRYQGGTTFCGRDGAELVSVN